MKNGINVAERATLVHDLRGPLITVDGFVGELDRALDELEALITDKAKPEVIAARLAAMLNEDLRPCLDFVTSATHSMHERIEALSPTRDERDDE